MDVSGSSGEMDVDAGIDGGNLDAQVTGDVPEGSLDVGRRSISCNMLHVSIQDVALLSVLFFERWKGKGWLQDAQVSKSQRISRD